MWENELAHSALQLNAAERRYRSRFLKQEWGEWDKKLLRCPRGRFFQQFMNQRLVGFPLLGSHLSQGGQQTGR